MLLKVALNTIALAPLHVIQLMFTQKPLYTGNSIPIYIFNVIYLSPYSNNVTGIRINISITTCFRILLIILNVYIIYMCIIIMCNIELINKICLY